jgi:hypothetical protein
MLADGRVGEGIRWRLAYSRTLYVIAGSFIHHVSIDIICDVGVSIYRMVFSHVIFQSRGVLRLFRTLYARSVNG